MTADDSAGPPRPDLLAAALAEHEIQLPDDQVQSLAHYCAVLWHWNQRLNLTRHTDYDKFVSRDVVDTLVIERHLEPSEEVLDVGTGGGVPGILLAILRPDLKTSLAESVAKKAKAVGQIVAELQLPIAVHHARAEELLAEHSFDTLVARAVAPLAKLLTWFEPHWGAFERLLVIKGPAWVEERRAARERGLFEGLRLRKLDAWPLPGTQAESVLLEIKSSE